MGCCLTLSGITRGCESSIGGIRRAWAACADEAGSPTIANDMVSALPNASAWHEYEFEKQTGSFTTTITRSEENNSLFYSSDIVLRFSKQETSKRLEIIAIASSDTHWIIEDNNGKYWYFGQYSGVKLSDGTGETGIAFEDFNGYNITLNDLSNVMPYEVSETAMNAILNPGSGS